MSLRIRAAIVLRATIVLALSAASTVAADDFQIIVHPSNDVKSLSADELARIFTKKTVKWESGTAMQPVDQVPRSPVREAFTTSIHGKQVGAIVSYWQQQIFSGGSIPPPEKATSAAVMAYVRANPGAIGYVAVGAATEGVRVIAVH